METKTMQTGLRKCVVNGSLPKAPPTSVGNIFVTHLQNSAINIMPHARKLTKKME